jgi:phosphate transport system protein
VFATEQDTLNFPSATRQLASPDFLLQFRYEDILRRFDWQLEDLQTRLLEMGGRVESAIHDSISALVDRDEALARQVLANEPYIDALEIEIDDFAVGLMALHQPMARDMRFLSATIKINNDLERMGDLAAHIAERALSLLQQPPLPLLGIPHLAQLAWAMVHDSLEALVRQDAELAQRVLLSDDAVDRLRDGLYSSLIGSMERDAAAVPSAVHLLFVVRHLERIADHATNISEDVLFYLRGVDVRHRASLAE